VSQKCIVISTRASSHFGEAESSFRRTGCDPWGNRQPGDQAMRDRKSVLVVGAGKIGATIADLLTATGDYEVTVVDREQAQLDALDAALPVARIRLDITDDGALDRVLARKFAVLSAAPFHLTTRIAEAAARAGVHYLDLTEDVASTRRVKELAAGAASAFIP